MIKAMKVEGADLFYPGRFYVLMALRQSPYTARFDNDANARE